MRSRQANPQGARYAAGGSQEIADIHQTCIREPDTGGWLLCPCRPRLARGRSKAALALDQWESDLAPSTTLRKWFGHDPKRWEAFEQRYQSELASEEQQERMRRLLSDSRGRPISLIYGAKDENHNQAVVLRDVLSCLSEE